MRVDGGRADPQAADALEQLDVSVPPAASHEELVEALDRAIAQREVGSTDGMIERAPKEVAAACDMDRVVIYRIEDQMLLAEAFYVAGQPEVAADLLAFSRE